MPKNVLHELDVKRLYLPFKIPVTCPSCQLEQVYDFEEHYLNYPPINTPFNHGMCCEKCDTEWKVPLILNVSITLEKDESKCDSTTLPTE